jgi:hypothetical protein
MSSTNASTMIKSVDIWKASDSYMIRVFARAMEYLLCPYLRSNSLRFAVLLASLTPLVRASNLKGFSKVSALVHLLYESLLFRMMVLVKASKQACASQSRDERTSCLRCVPLQ